MNAFERLFPFVFPFFFAGLWIAITSILRSASGMRRELGVATGSTLRESGWGSASINGVGARNCAKVVEHAEGYVIRMMWLFGGGRLWLPKADLHVGDEQSSRFLVPRSRTIVSGHNRVVLYGNLVDAIASPGVSARIRPAAHAFFITVALACAPCAVAGAQAASADRLICPAVEQNATPANYLWWIGAQFTPSDTVILGLPVRAFGRDWVRATVLSRALLPVAAKDDPSALADSNAAGFVRDDDFNGDGVVDRAVTGVFETNLCFRGRFLAILSPASSAAPRVEFVTTILGGPGFSVLLYRSRELVWQSCMECDDLNRLQWTGRSYALRHDGPPSR
jgi:hypothetical protein